MPHLPIAPHPQPPSRNASDYHCRSAHLTSPRCGALHSIHAAAAVLCSPSPPLLSFIGSRLLQRILDFATKTTDVAEVYLHVQTSNDEALRFYQRFGFTITGTIENYYKRITPPDCYVVSKTISH